MDEKNLRYLKLLARLYPTIQTASSEIINLQAILSLPKGTEHYLSDIHGEYETFTHILSNASGIIKRKIDENFKNSLQQKTLKELATLIYYPEEKLKILSKQETDLTEWYTLTLHRLIRICRDVSSKFTRSKVRKALPKDFAYIIEELLHEQERGINKEEYYNGIIKTIIHTERTDEFIIAICKLIRRLVIDHLHIIGDIYDRGPSAAIVMDTLMKQHSVDIQWGNHDILWMGAAMGCKTLIATVLRISARYDNLDTVEEDYGINLLPLATFAMEYYKDDPCVCFEPKLFGDENYKENHLILLKQMHKAISILEFKLEGQLIKRNPHFDMQHRLLLDKIDYKKGTIKINGKEYELLNKLYPTIDPKDPFKLTQEEEILINRLRASFLNSEKLQKHIRFMFDKGSMYLAYNSKLMFHGCIPMQEDASFSVLNIKGKKYWGKTLLDKFDCIVRKCYFNGDNPETSSHRDYMWYLWAGAHSPLFGKDSMATFERYFIAEKETHVENKNPYFKHRDKLENIIKIMEEFGLDPKTSHVINGHVPVKARKGENPVKANGKLIVIDGGMARAYQKVTGNAGYTLIYNSYGLLLASHKPFTSTIEAIREEKDIFSTLTVLEKDAKRKRVIDTDVGKEIDKQIEGLKMLLQAYRKGLIKENDNYDLDN